jgi:hypothetical protein
VVVVAMLLGLKSTTLLCERRGEAETRYLLLHILLFPPSPLGTAARNAGKEEDWEPGKEDLRGNLGGRGGGGNERKREGERREAKGIGPCPPPL